MTSYSTCCLHLRVRKLHARDLLTTWPDTMIAELLGVAELIGSILRRASVGGRPSWVEPNTRVRTYSVAVEWSEVQCPVKVLYCCRKYCLYVRALLMREEVQSRRKSIASCKRTYEALQLLDSTQSVQSYVASYLSLLIFTNFTCFTVCHPTCQHVWLGSAQLGETYVHSIEWHWLT